MRLDATSFTGLLAPGSEGCSFGPEITWTGLDFGRVLAQVREASACNDEIIATYEAESRLALISLYRSIGGAVGNFIQKMISKKKSRSIISGISDRLDLLENQRWRNGKRLCPMKNI